MSPKFVSRKTLVVFVCGFLFCLFLMTGPLALLYGDAWTRRRWNLPAYFVPPEPHWHEEQLDQLVALDKEQHWHDSHSHTDELDSVAGDLQEKVRVLCWVLTSPASIDKKAKHVKATWGKRCNVLLFMSSADDTNLPAIGLKVPESYDTLWSKTRAAFKYIYRHYRFDADWFLKADDDTYVIVENLRHLLKNYNPKDAVYFGRRFRPYVQQGYMSGGAGYVLSREALDRLVKKAFPDATKCRSDPAGTAEDVELGQCLESVGVLPEDSRDSLGRERFHPFPPELHLIPGAVPRNNWYWEYNYYPVREGPDCCSDHAITFHYVSPHQMYIFEYFVYHLKPFGLSTLMKLSAQSNSTVNQLNRSAAKLSAGNALDKDSNSSKRPFSVLGKTGELAVNKQAEVEQQNKQSGKKSKEFDQNKLERTNRINS